MGIFGSILEKLRRGSASASPDTGETQRETTATTQQPQPTQQPELEGSRQGSLQDVDVDAVLSDIASKKGGGGNYRESIVDLLKLLDLDSSLNARKELAQELDVHAGPHGSAEQNVALHRAVMRRIAENGGRVPDSMRG
jgi:hypothetical protein